MNALVGTNLSKLFCGDGKDDMTKDELMALGAEMDLDLKAAKRKQEILTKIRRSR